MNVPFGTFYGANNGFECIIYIYAFGGRVLIYNLQMEVIVPGLPEGIQVIYVDGKLSKLFSMYVQGYKEAENNILYKADSPEAQNYILDEKRISSISEYLSGMRGLSIRDQGVLFSDSIQNYDFEDRPNHG